MILENSNIKLVVELHAAEMHSLVDKHSGKEWIWNANPEFWGQRNPILFPVVGSTYDQNLHIDGNLYQIGNHGFTRHANFECVEQTDSKIVLQFKSSGHTLNQYPYNFCLEVEYRLLESHIDIIYRITNESDKVMPFNFGLHPAFYHSNNGVDGVIPVEFFGVEDHLPESILRKDVNQVLEFSDEFFKTTPTLVLDHVKSSYVRLHDHSDYLDVSVFGYRWLAFWKKPKANFICIEPWYGHDDFEPFYGEFKDREGTLFLDPNRVFTTSYQIIPKGKKGEKHV